MTPIDEAPKLPERTNRAPKRPHHFKRAAVVMVVTLFALGGIFSWLGTRGGRMYDGAPPRNALAAPSITSHVAPEQAAETLKSGAAIHRMHCAGCHAASERLIGPSYQLIAARYRAQARGQMSGQASDASEAQALSAVAVAVNHPPPGWAAYAPGPAQPQLPPADRAAVAYWILHVADK